MPVYNECRWIEKVVFKVLDQRIKGIGSVELILVDDGSTDGTIEIVRKLAQQHKSQIVAVFHDKNQGKGAAIRTALAKMSGDLCIIQDADLEYDPIEYPLILEPMINGDADCVYGSRFVGTQAKRVLFFWHYVGNKFLTLLSNMFTNINLTDMETGYKAFRCDLIKTIPLRCQRFGFEPEITAKIARRKLRIYEVGISYRGRTYREGKKITWLDGFKAIFTIIRFWLIDDSSHPS